MAGKVLVISWGAKVKFMKEFKTPCECGGNLNTRYHQDQGDSRLGFAADNKLQTESISTHCVCDKCRKRATVTFSFLAGEFLETAKATGQSITDILSASSVQCQEGWIY